MTRLILVASFVCMLTTQADGPAKKPSFQELTAAPTSIDCAGQKLKVEAFLWRDFMPIAPRDGKPLAAVVTLLSADLMPLPKGLAIDTVWVVHGKDVWESSVKEVRRDGGDATRLEVVVRNGPKWGPGVEVDVIAAVRDTQKPGQLVRAAKQRIQRTD